MVLDELADYLEDQGIGTVDVDIFKGGLPLDTPLAMQPDAVVALVETPGLPPEYVHSITGIAMEQPVIQVIVRGPPWDYPTARSKAESAFVALGAITNQALSSVLYLWVLPLQSPWWLRTDDLDRPHIVFQVRCAKALS